LLAEDRAKLVAECPAATPGEGMARVFAGYHDEPVNGDARRYEWRAKKAVFRTGGAWVYADGEGTRRRYVVVDASGLSGLPNGLRRLRDAKGLASALGRGVEARWARALNGDARAATAIARLHRIYSRRA
jgi:hypothetical protein